MKPTNFQKESLLTTLREIHDLDLLKQTIEDNKKFTELTELKALVTDSIQMVSSGTENHLDAITLGEKISRITELLYPYSKFAVTDTLSPSKINQILRDLNKYTELRIENQSKPMVIHYLAEPAQTAHTSVRTDAAYVGGIIAASAASTVNNFLGWWSSRSNSASAVVSTKTEKPLFTAQELIAAKSRLNKVKP